MPKATCRALSSTEANASNKRHGRASPGHWRFWGVWIARLAIDVSALNVRNRTNSGKPRRLIDPMPRVYRLAIIALGLTLLASQGNSQQAERTALEVQPEPDIEHASPAPFGDQGAEDNPKLIERVVDELGGIKGAILDLEAKIEISESSDSTQHDIRILHAQENMALWAMWLFVATLGTIATAGVGIFYVRQTLMETRRLGQAEIRAYLSCEGGEYSAEESRMQCCAIVKNYGQSPATSISATYRLAIRHFGDDWNPTITEIEGVTLKGSAPPIPASATASVPLNIPWHKIEEVDQLFRDEVGRERVWFRIWGTLKWEDVFGLVQELEFQLTPRTLPDEYGPGKMAADNAELYSNGT